VARHFAQMRSLLDEESSCWLEAWVGDEFGVATFWGSLNIPIRSSEEFCLLSIIDVVAHGA